jgi:DNA-binding response OmpR family regulator
VDHRDNRVCALLVGEYPESRLLLHEVFRDAGWKLIEAKGRKQAIDHLNRSPIHVVIVNCEVSGWNWRSLLRNLSRMPQPPQLIVTSRTADDHLWSEVLNCGGFDVLPEPFRRDEIERVVASARRHFGPPPTPALPDPAPQVSLA